MDVELDTPIRFYFMLDTSEVEEMNTKKCTGNETNMADIKFGTKRSLLKMILYKRRFTPLFNLGWQVLVLLNSLLNLLVK